MNVTLMFADLLDQQSDDCWFLDHGRRELRFRASIGNHEPPGYGVLIHRDGRKHMWPVDMAAFEVASFPDTLQVIWNAMEIVAARKSEAAGSKDPAA